MVKSVTFIPDCGHLSEEEYNSLVDFRGHEVLDRDCTMKVLLHFNDLYSSTFLDENDFPKELMGALVEDTIFGYTTWSHDILREYKCDHGDAYYDIHRKFNNIFKEYFISHPDSFASVISEDLPQGVIFRRDRLAAEKSSTEKFWNIFSKYATSKKFHKHNTVLEFLGVTAGYLKYYEKGGYSIPLEIQLQILQGIGADRSEIVRIIQEFYPVEIYPDVGTIPENFVELYNSYLKDELTMKEMENKLKVPSSRIYKWQKALDLPVKSEIDNKKASLEFQKVYPKYYADELTKDDIFKMFNIEEETFQKWVGKLDLPIKEQKTFLKKDSMEGISVISETKLEENSAFKFNLLGYEFSFGVKKQSSSESINLTDEFPDEIEY